MIRSLLIVKNLVAFFDVKKIQGHPTLPVPLDQGQDRAQLFVHDANDFAIIRSGFDEYTLKSVRFRTLRSNVRTSRATATVSSMSANRSRVGHSRRVRAFMLLVFACRWRLTPRSSRLPVPQRHRCRWRMSVLWPMALAHVGLVLVRQASRATSTRRHQGIMLSPRFPKNGSGHHIATAPHARNEGRARDPHQAARGQPRPCFGRGRPTEAPTCARSCTQDRHPRNPYVAGVSCTSR